MTACLLVAVGCEDDTGLKCEDGQRAVTTRAVSELVDLDANANGWVCVDAAYYPTVTP